VPRFVITFGYDRVKQQTIEVQMGTSGRLDGLTQFKGSSTAAAEEQDGYEAGRLSTVSFNNDGVIVGVFSNGVKKNIASVGIALFQNPSELERIGGGYFVASANSSEAVPVRAMTGGSGAIHGGALEKSGEVVASEFGNMIQTQNGFRANERVIKVANEILQEMSNRFR
jgi:flagellar hook protein FlgE